jgi:DNA-directed RNA polymerase specialized sigma subunit
MHWTEKSDAELVKAVQSINDSDALNEIFQRHTGIYNHMVGKYSAIKGFDSDELFDDRPFNIYSFVMDYDPSRKMKLSTYIGQMARFKCLKSLEKNRANKRVFTEEIQLNENLEEMSLTRNRPDPKAEEAFTSAINEIDSNTVMRLLEEKISDPLVASVIRAVHFPPSGVTPTWDEVGTRVGISKEWARQTYLRGMKKIVDASESIQ